MAARIGPSRLLATSLAASKPVPIVRLRASQIALMSLISESIDAIVLFEISLHDDERFVDAV
jgi:hypothetical protein